MSQPIILVIWKILNYNRVQRWLSTIITITYRYIYIHKQSEHTFNRNVFHDFAISQLLIRFWFQKHFMEQIGLFLLHKPGSLKSAHFHQGEFYSSWGVRRQKLLPWATSPSSSISEYWSIDPSYFRYYFNVNMYVYNI